MFRVCLALCLGGAFVLVLGLSSAGCGSGEPSNEELIKKMEDKPLNNPPLPEENFVPGREQMMKDLGKNRPGGR